MDPLAEMKDIEGALRYQKAPQQLPKVALRSLEVTLVACNIQPYRSILKLAPTNTAIHTLILV